MTNNPNSKSGVLNGTSLGQNMDLPMDHFKTIDHRRSRAQTAMRRNQSNMIKRGKQMSMNQSIDVNAKGAL